LIGRAGSSSPLPLLLFPPFSLLLPFPTLPYPLEVGPYIAARGSGGALKLPQREWAEPSRQTVSGAF